MLHLFSCFRFGLPFVLYIERTVNWDTLQKEILEKMRHLLRPGVYIQVGNETKWFLCGLFFFFFLNGCIVELCETISTHRWGRSVSVWSVWLGSPTSSLKTSDRCVTPRWTGESYSLACPISHQGKHLSINHTPQEASRLSTCPSVSFKMPV